MYTTLLLRGLFRRQPGTHQGSRTGSDRHDHHHPYCHPHAPAQPYDLPDTLWSRLDGYTHTNGYGNCNGNPNTTTLLDPYSHTSTHVNSHAGTVSKSVCHPLPKPDADRLPNSDVGGGAHLNQHANLAPTRHRNPNPDPNLAITTGFLVSRTKPIRLLE
jgi:hypothetical protein